MILIWAGRNAFAEDMTFIPATRSSTQSSWVTLDSCVWDAPQWFSFKHRLGALEGYQRLSSLFVATLGVADAEYFDYLDYLKQIKASKSYLTPEAMKIPLLYAKLCDEARGALETEEIKWVNQ